MLCSILDGTLKPASVELVQKVQALICPLGGNAEPSDSGYGIAPIGASVTICTGQKLPLNISMTVQFESGLENGAVLYKTEIEQKIEEYLSSVRQVWGAVLKSPKVEYMVTVYVSRIIYAVLSIAEVVNVTDVLVNGEASDLTCLETSEVQQVPVLGTVIINGG